MDALDLRMFAAVSGNRLAWWAASDPRLSARAIAQELGIDRNTVSARLRQWIERGFLVERQFLPNPALFGETFTASLVRLRSPLEKPTFFEAFADVEGAIAALDATGADVVVILAHATADALARQRRNLARLPHVLDVRPGRPFPVPPPSVEPTGLDARLMRTLRDQRDGGPETLAAALGVTSRTIRRRHKLLLEGRTLWCITVFDFTRSGVGAPTSLLVGLDAGASPAAVAKAMRETLPSFLEYPSLRGLVWEHSGPVVQAFVPLPTAAAAEDAQRALLALPGVAAVDASFPHRLHFTDGWARDRLERIGPPTPHAAAAPKR